MREPNIISHTCKLDSGRIAHYDVCGEMCNEYRKNFTLIGGGVIWEINNIQQISTERRLFFVKK